jgi:hypothetical protein
MKYKTTAIHGLKEIRDGLTEKFIPFVVSRECP